MADFIEVPDRRKFSNSIKWNRYPQDVLPMWIADMDFPAPEPILAALHKAVVHGVLGYEFPGRALKETVVARMDGLHGWKVKPDAVVVVPGIVSGYTVAARMACTPRKGVLIQPPVYNEFLEVKNNIKTPQLDAPLIKHVNNGILSYEINWDVFEKQAKRAGMFLLCNPHNPLGIIFPRRDLMRMAEICIRHNVLIVSDEIHSELLLDDNKFTPMARLSSEIAKHTITLVAPSKTFNVPGLFCGFAIIPDRELRGRYEKVVEHMQLHVASLGLVAAQAAFSGECDAWLEKLRRHLTGNRDFLVDYVSQNLPGARTTIPSATYLGWLDFSQCGISGSPFEFFMDKAKVAFSDGRIFGQGGEGHVRLNFGTSRTILKDGLDRVRDALACNAK
jgi:cystathionine beta-lyase